MSIVDGTISHCKRFIISRVKSTDEDLLGHIRVLSYSYAKGDDVDELDDLLSAIHQTATMKRKVWLSAWAGYESQGVTQ